MTTNETVADVCFVCLSPRTGVHMCQSCMESYDAAVEAAGDEELDDLQWAASRARAESTATMVGYELAIERLTTEVQALKAQVDACERDLNAERGKQWDTDATIERLTKERDEAKRALAKEHDRCFDMADMGIPDKTTRDVVCSAIADWPGCEDAIRRDPHSHASQDSVLAKAEQRGRDAERIRIVSMLEQCKASIAQMGKDRHEYRAINEVLDRIAPLVEVTP